MFVGRASPHIFVKQVFVLPVLFSQKKRLSDPIVSVLVEWVMELGLDTDWANQLSQTGTKIIFTDSALWAGSV